MLEELLHKGVKINGLIETKSWKLATPNRNYFHRGATINEVK